MARHTKTTYSISCDRCGTEVDSPNSYSKPEGWMSISTSHRFTDAAGSTDTSTQEATLCKCCTEILIEWFGDMGRSLYLNSR